MRRIGLGPNAVGRVVAGLALITTTSLPVLTGVTEARLPAVPQAAGPGATFEVASIRVNRDVSDRPTLLRPILQQGGRVLMTRQTVRDLIQAAYRVRDNELIDRVRMPTDN